MKPKHCENYEYFELKNLLNFDKTTQCKLVSIHIIDLDGNEDIIIITYRNVFNRNQFNTNRSVIIEQLPKYIH